MKVWRGLVLAVGCTALAEVGCSLAMKPSASSAAPAPPSEEGAGAGSSERDKEDAALRRKGFAVLCEDWPRSCKREMGRATFELLKSRYPVERSCDDKDAKVGEPVADMYGTVYGAFTHAGVREELTIVDFYDCPPRATDEQRIVLVRDESLVIDVDSQWNLVRCHQDLDGDGDDELILSRITTEDDGIVREAIAVVNVKDGALEIIHDFGVTSQFDCLFGESKMGSTEAQLYYRKASGKLDFEVRSRHETCESRRRRLQ